MKKVKERLLSLNGKHFPSDKQVVIQYEVAETTGLSMKSIAVIETVWNNEGVIFHG